MFSRRRRMITGGFGFSSARSYLGAVSTGTHHLNFQNAVGASQLNSRSPHKNPGQAVTRLKVVLGNWNSTSSGEASLGSNTTFTASIEYPVGVYTQVTFGGSASGVAAPFTNLESDWCTISIPQNTRYWVRIYASNPTGFMMYYDNTYNVTSNSSMGQALELNATVDKTMSGTITETYNRYYYYPQAILSDVTTPSFLILGDSINDGATDFYDGTNYGIGYAERALEPYYGFMNMATYGETAQNFNTGSRGAARKDLAKYCSHVWCNYGINDIRSGGLTAAQARDQLITLFGNFPTKKGIQMYISTFASSTDSYATLANQTLETIFLPGDKRDQLNAFIAANQCGNVASIDLQAAFIDAATNKWKVDGTPNKYTSDGGHPSQFAHKAAAALFNTGMIP